ncbi:MAG: Mrp/NBP35 family ATP-binding protein, partial [Clostridia bacterium]|nr:Mrp/NBP35 family ATP-binding protein [Clostridia bacterium]
MSENCTHNCSTCSKGCGANQEGSLIKSLLPGTSVKKVIAVVSGKGGVGKSATCALLAAMSKKKGYTTAVLDADVTGPSLPKMFGVNQKARGSEAGLLPVRSPSGIQTMSMNLLLEEDTQPVLWRGSLIAGAAVQFWTDVLWEDVDYMFVDMPPGTGDVPLSIFQSLPLAGIVVVTTPQDLVKMIVEKALNMADKMNVPVLGLVENMSYYVCPCCGEKTEIFGQSKAGLFANEYGMPVARMPIDPTLAALADAGKIEEYSNTQAEKRQLYLLSIW